MLSRSAEVRRARAAYSTHDINSLLPISERRRSKSTGDPARIPSGRSNSITRSASVTSTESSSRSAAAGIATFGSFDRIARRSTASRADFVDGLDSSPLAVLSTSAAVGNGPVAPRSSTGSRRSYVA